MTFQSATYVGGATTHALDLMNEIKARLDAHASWTWVERVAGSVGGRDADVFESTDGFFVVVAKNTDTGSVGFGVCEDYDAVNKKAIRPTVYGPSSIQGDYSVAAQPHVANNNTVVSQTADYLAMGAISAGAGTWRLISSITAQRIIFSNRGGAPNYCGRVDPWPGTNYAGRPLLINGVKNETNREYATRTPGTTTTTHNQIATALLSSLGWNVKDQLRGKWWYWRPPIRWSVGGGFLGRPLDLVQIGVSGLSVNPDDRVMVGADEWCFLDNGGWAVDTTA